MTTLEDNPLEIACWWNPLHRRLLHEELLPIRSFVHISAGGSRLTMNCIPEASKTCYELVSHGCKKGLQIQKGYKPVHCSLLVWRTTFHKLTKKLIYHTFTQMTCITTEQFMLCVVQGFAESLQHCIRPQSSVTALYGSFSALNLPYKEVTEFWGLIQCCKDSENPCRCNIINIKCMCCLSYWFGCHFTIVVIALYKRRAILQLTF